MSVVPISRAGITNGTTDKLNHARASVPQGSSRVYMQTFTSPGTWTWPGRVSAVEVLVVSGGGAGLTGPTVAPVGPTTPSAAVFAGSGGVGSFCVNVSGPVPVTVGAGGTAQLYPGVASVGPLPGGNGGTSAFGPITPPIPANTAWLSGGSGAGAPTDPAMSYTTGGGLASDTAYPNVQLGTQSFTQYASGARVSGNYGGSAVANSDAEYSGSTKYGYGGGARTNGYPVMGRAFILNAASSQTAVPNIANTGHAGTSHRSGAGTPIPVMMQGLDGGSGIVIVRWYE